ncbi:MAG: hypothetical protein K6G15_03115 [Desulfovibrio sp.]|nr:hypothetical protein [Desulfovibrio sp.]
MEIGEKYSPDDLVHVIPADNHGIHDLRRKRRISQNTRELDIATGLKISEIRLHMQIKRLAGGIDFRGW